MKLAGIIGFFVIALALLLFQTKQTTTSTMRMPSELAALGNAVSVERLQVAGRVSALPIDYQTVREQGGSSILKLTFSIQDPPARSAVTPPVESPPPAVGPSIPVVYLGVKPDMFAPGRDVIIDGNYENGTLKAVGLRTQCPSKYQPPDPVKQAYPEPPKAP